MKPDKLLAECQHWSQDPRVLWVIFSLTLAASFYRGYGFSNNSYAMASWLVTYESGFIKRGLAGSLLQLEVLSRLSGLSVPTLFFAITNTLLAFLHVLVLFIVMRLVSLHKIALLFIPYFLLGPLLRTQSVWIGNIDHLLAILMIAIAYCLIKEKVMPAAMISITGIFIHEIIFAMTFPVWAFWLLMNLTNPQPVFAGHYHKIVLAILANIAAVLWVILYHDLFFSGEQASAYINQLISRQAEDHYNSGAITEAYTKSFWEWFLFQKEYIAGRIFDSGLLLVVVVPAFAFLGLNFLLSSRVTKDIGIFAAAFILVLSPLAVLLIAWDIDRIWNLSIWVLFLILWLQWESGTHRHFHSRPAVLILCLISIPAFLMPQVRSNLDWSLLPVIYAPFILWQIVFIAGCFYKNQK